MSYQLIIKHAVKHRAYTDKRPFKLWGGMLHSVGCNQPSAHNWADRWNRATAPVIANYVTEPDLAIETLPPSKRPWTSGSGKNGNANDFMFQVEMAEPASLKYGNGGKFTVSQDKLLEAKDYVKRNYETAVKLFADTFKKYGLDPLGKMPNGYPTIMSHAEGAKYGIASNHGDPEHLWRQLYLPYTMDTFRADVVKAMRGTTEPPKQDTGVRHRVQVGSFANRHYAEAMLKDLEAKGYKPYITTVNIDDKPVKRATLKLGSKGEDVKVLQTLLMGLGYKVIVVDGDFGKVTDKAVREYQADHGLVVDGIVGEQTWGKLER